jgi:hypothetical protein
VEKGIAINVGELVVTCLGLLDVEASCNFFRKLAKAELVDVARRALKTDNFAAGDEVGELMLEKLVVVAHHVDRWLMGRLTTLSRSGRGMGVRLLLIHGNKWAC